MVGLLLVCLLPRALAALWIPSINPDGAYYIDLARSLERGDLAGELQGMNIYPAILLGVHCAGLDWETAAKVWGVLASTLVVLPLYGWVRRQFDDRVALTACFLYIVHPKFIELSPEVIRDSTFWLFLMLALYWQWRAIVEVRLGMFVVAGAATTAACLTRFEGLYLFLPLGLWSGWRCCALRSGRARLAAGVAISLASLPALVLAANLLWVQTRGEWLLPRFEPGARALAWLHGIYGRLTDDPASEMAAADSISLGRMLCVFFPIMTRGLSPCFALLMFGGLWKWRRTWAQRDHQPLFFTAIVVLLGNWIQLWFDRQLCFRYALPIVLMASPFAALGLLGATARAASLAGRLRPRGGLRWIGAVGPSALVAAAGVTAAWLSLEQTFAPRKAAAALGVWLRGQCPPCPTLVGPSGLTAVAGYYAQARCRTYRRDTQTGDDVASLVERVRPDAVLVLATRHLGVDQCAALVDRMRPSGLEPVETPQTVRDCGELCVLIRRDGAWAQARPASSKTAAPALSNPPASASSPQQTAARDSLFFLRSPEPRTLNPLNDEAHHAPSVAPGGFARTPEP